MDQGGKATKRTSNLWKEVDIMSTAVKLREDELIFANELRDYVLSLKEEYKTSPDKARDAAREALIRTGVMSEDGVAKKKIVSWE